MSLKVIRTAGQLDATAAGKVTAMEVLELCDQIAHGKAKALVDCTKVTDLPNYGELRHESVLRTIPGQRVAIVCSGPMVRGGMRMISTLYLFGSELQLFESLGEAMKWLNSV